MLCRLSPYLIRPVVGTLGGAAASFDYYISATGDDNNSGTLVSPWSITALNSKRSTYAGKRVGLISGTYTQGTVGGINTTIYSLMVAAGSTLQPVFQVQGGPDSSNKTYIGSCDSSGNYSPRAALIDATNPSGGATATNDACVMGQRTGGSITQYGNITIQGVKIRGASWASLQFYNSSLFTDLTIEDCEIYDQTTATSNSNPGGVWLQFASGAIVRNNYLHDMQTSGGTLSPWGCVAIMTFDSVSTQITNNVIVNAAGIYGKDHYQPATIRYNYIDHGSFGSANPGSFLAAIRGFIPDTGQTTTIEHNILIGQLWMYGGDQNGVVGTVVVQHNTFYQTQNSAQPLLLKALSTTRLTWKDNLIYYTGTTFGGMTFMESTVGGVAVTSTIMPTCDYNAYKSTFTFSPWLYGTVSGNSATEISLTQWKAWESYGFDAHALSLASSPFSTTPTTGNVSTFGVTGAAATASSTGGPVGAVDGSGTVGKDW